jgi:hypothetical protein
MICSSLCRVPFITVLLLVSPKVVQGLLRHGDVHTTLQLYSQSVSADRLVAQGTMLDAMGVRPGSVN